MIWVDLAILVVVALSAAIGFFRGLLREALGLASWILAFYVAFVANDAVSELLAPWIEVGSARRAVAFGVVFIGILILGAVVNHLIGRLVAGTGFAGTDRVLGAGFGVLRAVAMLIVLVLLAGLVTPLPQDDWWQRSLFLDHLEDGAYWLHGLLPDDLVAEPSYPDRVPASDTSTT